MKYIDARTQMSLKQGLMEYLLFDENDLYNLFVYVDLEDIDPFNFFNSFIEECGFDESLEYIHFFHLTRRLNGTNPQISNNLEHLLITETPISDFFKKHSVTFKRQDGHISLYYKDILQPLDKTYLGNSNVSYIKKRLGYNKVQDYCYNGFAFRTHLEDNLYFRYLSRCPEIVDKIGDYLEIDGMASDYYNNSTYYCIEYLIPFSKIVFDVDDSMKTEQEKRIVFLTNSLVRLYKEWKNLSFCGDENLILRLDDYADINSDWFVNAEKLNL